MSVGAMKLISRQAAKNAKESVSRFAVAIGGPGNFALHQQLAAVPIVLLALGVLGVLARTRLRMR